MDKPADTAPADSFAHTVATALFGNKAHDDVRSQIFELAAFRQNANDVEIGQTDQPAFDMPPELLAHHAVLFFQCDGKIAKKVAHLENEHGQPLITRDGVSLDGKEVHFVNIWNAKTQEYDLYEEILAERDPKTGFQGAAFFDHTRDRMTFNFGGTDFTNPRDMFISGGQMIGGKVDNRMTRAAPFTDQAMQTLHDRHPELAETAPIDMAGHSTGPNAMALAKYCLDAKWGRKVRSQHIVEPAGAINAYKLVSDMIAEAEKKSSAVTFSELTQNAQTYKAKKGSFIGWFPKLSQNIGDIALIDVKGGNDIARHMGAAWINGFMDEARQITVRAGAPKDTGPSKDMGRKDMGTVPQAIQKYGA